MNSFVNLFPIISGAWIQEMIPLEPVSAARMLPSEPDLMTQVIMTTRITSLTGSQESGFR